MDEKDMLEKINTLDFSRYSAKHKEQLWKRLNETRGRRVLREDELEVSAAGVCEDHKCTRCGSVNVDSQGKCGDCGRENL